MDTHLSTCRSALADPLLASLTAALLMWAASAQSSTLYTLQVAANTTDGGSHFAYYFPLTYSTVPLDTRSSYIAPVGPHVGCCEGSYDVGASASDAHGGTAIASAQGSLDFAGSTAPDSGQVHGATLAYAVVSTYFQLVGPVSATPIGVDLAWQMSASSTGSGSAYADLEVNGGPGNGSIVFHQTLTSVFASGIADSQAGEVDEVMLFPNQPYAMNSTARAAGSSTFFSAPYDQGAGSAFVDPLFTLPDAYRDLYHFVGLPASVVTAPVPEPSIVLILTAGLAAVGIKSRAKFLALGSTGTR
jgi:hypothetical protein